VRPNRLDRNVSLVEPKFFEKTGTKFVAKEAKGEKTMTITDVGGKKG